jgi:4-diphosphocytidyl-2-C-methyl-D-erythritol kinase
MIVFPNCKINLGLHILQKRPDGFHDLQTVFYPIPLQDALEVIQNPVSTDDEIQLSTSGLSLDAPTEQNICVKAYRILKKDFPQLPSIKMHLHKTIPSGAGLGGGSSDAAFTLIMLNKKFHLGLNEDGLIDYAAQLGSDCAFFIRNQPVYATGRGEKLEAIELDLSDYKIVLVHPGIHLNTAVAFSGITPNNTRTSLLDTIRKPVAQWKENLVNDFEATVFVAHPQIKAIKGHLYQKGAIYASMTGSGSTVYGLFGKNESPQLEFGSEYMIKVI